MAAARELAGYYRVVWRELHPCFGVHGARDEDGRKNIENDE